MARNKEKNGFNLNNLSGIVNLDSSKQTTKDSAKIVDKEGNKEVADNNHDNSINNGDNKVPTVRNNELIANMVVEKEEKTRVISYLDPDLAYKLKEYGRIIGRKGGGSSKLANMAIEEFFKNHNL